MQGTKKETFLHHLPSSIIEKLPYGILTTLHFGSFMHQFRHMSRFLWVSYNTHKSSSGSRNRRTWRLLVCSCMKLFEDHVEFIIETMAEIRVKAKKIWSDAEKGYNTIKPMHYSDMLIPSTKFNAAKYHIQDGSQSQTLHIINTWELTEKAAVLT